MILPYLFEIKREKQEQDIQENGIPSPSRLWFAANESREATFRRIAGFFYKYPCIMSYDKGEHTRLGWMVKYIAFWYIEQIESTWIYVNSSKGSLEEVAKALDV